MGALEDHELRFIMLGAFAAMAHQDAFPVKVDRVERIDDDGVAEAIRIVTESGLRFRVDVTFEGG